MKNLVGCLIIGLTVTVHAQDFTSAPAKLARDNYLNGLSKLDATYKAALESALRQADMKKDIEEADRIKAALADIAENESLAAMAPGQMARLTFRTVKVYGGKPLGCEIGKFAKGDKVVVKYDKGMFSGQGIPLTSPDEEPRLKCIIGVPVGDKWEAIATIPTGSKTKPYEFTFPSAFRLVALMPDWSTGGMGGEVSYKVAIIRAK